MIFRLYAYDGIVHVRVPPGYADHPEDERIYTTPSLTHTNDSSFGDFIIICYEGTKVKLVLDCQNKNVSKDFPYPLAVDPTNQHILPTLFFRHQPTNGLHPTTLQTAVTPKP